VPFNPFSTLGAKLSMGMSAILICVILFIGYTKNNEIKGLQDDKDRLITRVATVERAFGTCQANNATLTASLARQNASVADLARTTATQAEAGLAALGDVRRANGTIRTEVVRIGTSKAGPDVCKSANDLITESLK
jgi:hypothetical protein